MYLNNVYLIDINFRKSINKYPYVRCCCCCRFLFFVSVSLWVTVRMHFFLYCQSYFIFVLFIVASTYVIFLENKTVPLSWFPSVASLTRNTKFELSHPSSNKCTIIIIVITIIISFRSCFSGTKNLSRLVDDSHQQKQISKKMKFRSVFPQTHISQFNCYYWASSLGRRKEKFYRTIPWIPVNQPNE